MLSGPQPGGAPRRPRSPGSQRGAAVVDFTLVGLLVTTLFLALLQLGFDLHVRNVIAASAEEGARLGADANETPAAGAALANALITQTVGSRYAHAVAVPGQYADGLSVVTVEVRDRLPLLVGFLPAITITVRGRALQEPP